MDYSRYSRAVILFEERGREFAADLGKEIKGYLRVETGNGRGAFRCVIQNIKFFPHSEYTYKLILFGKRGERTIHTVVGNIPVTRFGTGEVYLRFRPQDVDGQGNDYGRYTSVIVAAVSSKNQNEQLHPVLMGKTGHHPEEAPWQTSAAEISAMRVKEQVPPGETVAADSSTSQATSATSQVTPVTSQATPATSQVTTTSQATPAQDSEAIQAQDNAGETFPASERTTAKAQQGNFNRFYNNYLLNLCRYLCGVPGYYEEVHPFRPDTLHAQWMKISNPKSMFFVSPGAQYFAAKYGHFLLGNRGNETYYLAVPGRFRKEEQPDEGESGFCYWLPVGEAEKDRDSYGYWVVAIDGRTGDIEAPALP